MLLTANVNDNDDDDDEEDDDDDDDDDSTNEDLHRTAGHCIHWNW